MASLTPLRWLMSSYPCWRSWFYSFLRLWWLWRYSDTIVWSPKTIVSMKISNRKLTWSSTLIYFWETWPNLRRMKGVTRAAINMLQVHRFSQSYRDTWRSVRMTNASVESMSLSLTRNSPQMRCPLVSLPRDNLQVSQECLLEALGRGSTQLSSVGRCRSRSLMNRSAKSSWLR